MSSELSAAAIPALYESDSPAGVLERISPVFQQNSQRLSNILRQHDSLFRLQMSLLADSEYEHFLFLSERMETTCDRCSAHHGELMPIDDVQRYGLVPPLHPNCKCRLVAMDSRAARMYNLDRNRFASALDGALKPIGENAGGIFLLDRGFVSLGVSPIKLTPLEPPETPTVTDSAHDEPKWYDKLGKWAFKFVLDIAGAFQSFADNQAEIYERYEEAKESGEWGWAILHRLDLMTLGIISGINEANVQRHEIMDSDPSLYNILNYISLGIVEGADRALFPEEPGSFAHFMDMIGLVTLLFGAYKGIKILQGRAANNAAGIAAGSSDELARIAAGSADDFVDDGARAAAGTIDDGAKGGVTRTQANEILKIPPGKRPSPSSYLSKGYIDSHLANFKSGVTKISPSTPSGRVGAPGGTFVMPSSIADDIIRQAGGNISKLEDLLGLPRGSLGPSPVRIDIKNPHGLRIPSGNEMGANSQWLPGGYTSGGIIEAVIDPVEVGGYIVNSIW